MRHCEEVSVNKHNAYFYTLHFKNYASVNNTIKVINVDDFKFQVAVLKVLNSRVGELKTKFKVKVIVIKTLNSRL